MQRLFDTGLMVLLLAALATPGQANPAPQTTATSSAQQSQSASVRAQQPVAKAASERSSKQQTLSERDRLTLQYRLQQIIPTQD